MEMIKCVPSTSHLSAINTLKKEISTAMKVKATGLAVNLDLIQPHYPPTGTLNKTGVSKALDLIQHQFPPAGTLPMIGIQPAIGMPLTTSYIPPAGIPLRTLLKIKSKDLNIW